MRTEIALSHEQLRDASKGDMHSLRADVASDLSTIMQAMNEAEHKSTRDHVVRLRRALGEHHCAAPGHGMLVSDLEARVRRFEQTLGVLDA